tara:strand:- start:564 stop:680 length:117 start_codon:yes stop_codon:yes gene_type:complete
MKKTFITTFLVAASFFVPVFAGYDDSWTDGKNEGAISW